MIQRTAVLAGAIAGGLAGSQAPEFAAQYNQNLAGRIGELESLVLEWDANAERAGYTRDEALRRDEASEDQLTRDNAATRRLRYDRYELLVRQRDQFQEWPRLAHPLILLGGYDAEAMESAWDNYHPALPGTLVAMGWLGAGLLIGGMLIWGPWRLARGFVSRRRDMGRERA